MKQIQLPDAKKEPPTGVSRWLGDEVGDRVLAGV